VLSGKSMESRLLQALLDGEDRFRDLLAKHRTLLAEKNGGAIAGKTTPKAASSESVTTGAGFHRVNARLPLSPTSKPA